MNLVKTNKDERIYISNYGLKKMLEREIDPKYPAKGAAWTDDFRC